jgi:type I restriction enzyme R subunit
MDCISKTIFIVDRKDLDYQTMKEYDKFQKNSVNGSKDTKELKKGLEDSNKRILVTTIQKMNQFIKLNSIHEIYKQNVVLIFDECHRSQFGEFHKNITDYFKNYYIFGFTGTPIFAANSSSSNSINLKTTEQAFGARLHSYTIIDAINDNNVLPFRVDYVNTIKAKDNILGQTLKIDTEAALLSKERISAVTKYILEHFAQKTARNRYYELKQQRINGFNSIFAVQSIEAAKKYYEEFFKQQNNLPENSKLKIATIFSFSPNEEDPLDGVLGEEEFEVEGMEKSSREFLEHSIKDYNSMFNTNFSTSGDNKEGFQNYYKDISLRMKQKGLDILIVVNMFLTGFDATTLNTLWVDKNLRLHGLLQAFSRTNRILNEVKTFGNIVCFRDLEKNVDESISLFGDRDAKGIVLLKTFSEYYNGYEKDGKRIEGYKELINKLEEKFGSLQIIGEQNEKEFIKLFGGILKVKNILSSFDEFIGSEILTEMQFQDYQSVYLDLYNKLRNNSGADKENINDDLIFELELVKQTEINIDYILHLVEKYHDSHCKNKEILSQINKAISSSPSLRLKKELIEEFIKQINSEKKQE